MDIQKTLEQLTQEVTNLTSYMHEVSQLAANFENRLRDVEKANGTSENQKNLDDRLSLNIENRLKHLEDLMKDRVIIRDADPTVGHLDTPVMMRCSKNPLTEQQISLEGVFISRGMTGCGIQDTTAVAYGEACTGQNAVSELASVVDSVQKQHMTPEGALAALPVVLRYGMTNIRSKICSVLLKDLTLVNCIQIFMAASQYALGDVLKAAQKLISDNFYLLCEKDVIFCDLSLDQLVSLVFSDSLVATEEHVFRGICNWVTSDLNNRKPLVTELFPAIRLTSCGLRFLSDLKNHFLVIGEAWFLNCVEERIAQLTSDPQQAQRLAKGKWRRSKVLEELIVLGGSKSEGVVETYNFSDKTWTEHQIMDPPTDDVMACVHEGGLLVLENDRFRRFDLLTRKWSTLSADPDTFRSGSCVAQADGGLYILGGEGKEYNTRCDFYDAWTDTWTRVASLKKERECSASASLGGLVYCCGGLDPDLFQPISSVEAFTPSPSGGKWNPEPPLTVARFALCLVSCGRFLWAIGGWKESSRLPDVERFSPGNPGTWSRRSPMPTTRGFLSASVHGSLIYAVAGAVEGINEECTETPAVEVYDTEQDSWTSAECLHRARYGHASCLVQAPPFTDAD